MTTGTLTLTAFLLARLAEDEAESRAVLALLGSGTTYPLGHPLDPARVLVDVEAKRTLVEKLQAQRMAAPQIMSRWLDSLLRILASVYADHNDYRNEWKP